MKSHYIERPIVNNSSWLKPSFFRRNPYLWFQTQQFSLFSFRHGVRRRRTLPRGFLSLCGCTVQKPWCHSTWLAGEYHLLMGKYGRIIKQNGSCSSTPWDSFLEFSPRIVWFIINIAYKNMRSPYFIPEIDRNWMMNTSNQRWHSLYTRECSASTWLWIRN